VLVLAFDTTSEHGGAGIYRDEQCLLCATNQGPANLYSVTLFQIVEGLFSDARLSLRDIELFAVATGPGSFTGIRVGLAAAKGWGTACDRPVQGISVLEAIVDAAGPQSECAIPIVDARRGEFYVGLYRRLQPEGRFEPQGEGRVLNAGALPAFLQQLRLSEPAAITCIAREHDRLSQSLSLPASLQWQIVSGSLVGSLARLALRAHGQGRTQSAAQLDACYIRRPDAELLFPRVPGRDKVAGS
jgi:tRNA threonylcarbamoyladenosine biosynthesis protein TsaB